MPHAHIRLPATNRCCGFAHPHHSPPTPHPTPPPPPQVCDIKALAEIAHAAGALCLVDNSFMSPIFQRPLELAADISMISGTKFIGGHSDVTCGVLSVSAGLAHCESVCQQWDAHS
jgi:cystathionine beta-lyase/cystathionine gamma-synthase